jgi:Flp pilus assembly protein TadB
VIVPPLVFYAEVVLILALGAVAAAWLLYDPDDRPRPPSRRARQFMERQRDISASIGMRPRNWLALRIGVGLLGALIGSLASLWTVALLGALLGWFGMPWLLGGRAAKRRLAMERAVAAAVREVANLMQQSNLSLDRALREAANNPVPELEHVLSPLRSDRSVPECLADVSRLARSPMVEMLCIAVMVARTHDPAAFVKVAEQVLGPILDLSIEVQEENHATVAQQRTAAIAIGVVMGVLFFAVMRVPTMHAFYATFPGQVVLLLVILAYLGLVWLIGQIAKPMTWTKWDVDTVRSEMEVLLA